jgi:predicted permease
VNVALVAAATVLSTAVGIAAERRYGERAQRAAHDALIATLYTLVPFVIFFILARATIDADAVVGVVLGHVALVVTALGAWALGTHLLHLARPQTGALICAVFVANTGYLGYPLVAALLGFDALGVAAAYDILVSAPSVLLVGFAVGAAFGDSAGEGVRDRVVAFFTRNPPLFAGIAALLAPDSLAPDVMVDISRGLIIAMLPLGFFAAGVALASEAEGGRLGWTPRLSAPVATAVLLRLVVAPGLLLLISLPLIDLPDPYLLLAAMPLGINTLVIAHAYGLDLRITAQALAWSTALAVLAALVGPLVF